MAAKDFGCTKEPANATNDEPGLFNAWLGKAILSREEIART